MAKTGARRGEDVDETRIGYWGEAWLRQGEAWLRKG